MSVYIFIASSGDTIYQNILHWHTKTTLKKPSKMKSIKLFTILFLFIASSKLAKADAKDTSGVFMTMDNEMVYMYGSASITAATVGYHDIKNKDRSYVMKKIKWMIFGNRVWCAFPIRKGDRTYRLQEIVAMNDKYILMYFWQGSPYLYVYDYNSDLIEGKILIYEGGFGSKRKNRKAYDVIAPYFSTCNDLMKKFTENLDKEQLLIKDIYVLQCDGAPDIYKFIATFKDKRMEAEKD
jgi:hypothetical protein